MINQDELIKGTLRFIERYKRLPYYSEDDIEIEKLDDDNELVLKPYRALKYIKEEFATHEKYTKYLLQNNILTYEIISEHTKIKPDRLNILLKGEEDKIEVSERRIIHIFFNDDYYEKLGMMCSYCKDCTQNKKCSQNYWVKIIQCPKYKKQKK